MLGWQLVAETLDSAGIYWISTVNPNGKPHLVPIHAACLGGVVYLAGDPASRWARNLVVSPYLEIGVNHAGLQVMVCGTAHLETPSAERYDELNHNIASKYEWKFDSGPTPMWIVNPDTVIAFDPSRFDSSPTRFEFLERLA